MRWRARAGAALDDDFAVAVDFGQALRDVVLRDERAADLGDLVLVGLADVEEENIFAGVEALLEFLHAELGDSVLHCCSPDGFRARCRRTAGSR